MLAPSHAATDVMWARSRRLRVMRAVLSGDDLAPRYRLRTWGMSVPPPGRFRLRDRRAWRSPDAPLPGRARPAGCGRTAASTSSPFPTAPAPAGGRPLVLNLHGFTSNLVQQAHYSRLPRIGAERGYVVVTPQGTGRVPRWTFPRLPGPDDAGFLRAVIDEVAAAEAVDERRVFSAGISNGAAMTMALADLWPGYFAAVAAVAGVNAIPARPVPRHPRVRVPRHERSHRALPRQHAVRGGAAGRRRRASPPRPAVRAARRSRPS